MKYSIEGEPLPVVICELEPGEYVQTEAGAMAWMSSNMKMETVGGGASKMLGRMFSGESLFLNKYTAEGGPGLIALSSNVPGAIKPFQISPGNEIVAQKNAFLAMAPGVELSTFFQKKIGAGFFGGEGFIMQKLSGDGMAFVEFDGYVKEYDLAAGESMLVNTGYLAAMTAGCSIDVKTVPGVKNMLFGGEGIFNTIINGPGHIWIHSMPVSALANAIRPFIPTSK
ncbi:MAG: TIGR00266 family protein [Lachnospiraceae bacterium]|nr:TIGR00266 family protein [Lachnospiraceae bacterium]